MHVKPHAVLYPKYKTQNQNGNKKKLSKMFQNVY